MAPKISPLLNGSIFAGPSSIFSKTQCRGRGSLAVEEPKINFANFRFHTDPFLQHLCSVKLYTVLKRLDVKPEIQLAISFIPLFPPFHIFLL